MEGLGGEQKVMWRDRDTLFMYSSAINNNNVERTTQGKKRIGSNVRP